MRMIPIACCMLFISFLRHSPRHVPEGNLVYIIITTRLILGWCTDGRKGVLEQAGGAEQHITEAAPNELKLGEGG